MTSTTPQSSLQHTALGDLERELSQTRRILERVPDDKFDWQPHAKSMTLGRLASHIAQLPRLSVVVLAQQGLDFAVSPPQRPTQLATRDELLRVFDEESATLRAALAAADDDALRTEWTLRAGPQVFLTDSRAGVLRTLGISHLVHHRGQLSVYLRLLDVPVPGLYGPSADER